MSEKKKSASQSEMEEPKSARATARTERSSKPAARRETKSSSASSDKKKSGGFRNWPPVRFTRESYRELRYKVTWPTFIEARNMTITVIALSTVVGLILGLVDVGLFQLFKVVTGK
jgi:preprotein translocase SecE subunit